MSGQRSWLWVALCTLHALAALAAARWADPQALAWRPERAWAEPWRWWTAADLHWSAAHLAANVAACAVLALLGWRARLTPAATLAWFIAWPLTHLALLVTPALTHYGGLSGVIHAGVAVIAVALALPALGLRTLAGVNDRRARLVGMALAIGLLAKLIHERPWAGATQWSADWTFAVAPVAHATGACAGALAALCVGMAVAARHHPTRTGA